MASYSQDLRDRVLNGLERGEGPTDIARRLEVSRRWVHQVRDRLRDLGLRESLQIGGYRRSRLEPMEQTIRMWIKEQPDLTLEQIGERLAEQGIEITTSPLWYQLDKWGLSFKKNAVRQRARARGRATGAY